jgi:hypothetical protein
VFREGNKFGGEFGGGANYSSCRGTDGDDDGDVDV